ncbi:MAG: divergent polysaccharide deacetylase family protein [Alphaproteobacteria bacterium]|nr:divergent polysaccharide deacetylase family protein [Alphaproteobacteria bacterium]
MIQSGKSDGDIEQERKETFLARYPRKLKLGVTVVILALVIAPWFSFDGVKENLANSVILKGKLAGITGREKNPLDELSSKDFSTEPAPTQQAIATDQKLTSQDQTTLNAIRENDADDHGARMPRAPESGLTEETPDGSLPRIGDNNRQPWQAYARPFNEADRRPRIAIVISELGLSNVATMTTVERMPSSVTLAFDVQSKVIGSWLTRARQVGHETLLSLPMEPFDYPRSDPGSRTLLTSLPDAENLDRLNWALRRGVGYVGVTTLSGSRFTTETGKLNPILLVLKQRGLMVFDAHVAPHSVLSDLSRQHRIPMASNTRRIDDNPSPEAIDTALVQLEQTARVNGRAVGLASPLPVTLDRLEAWIKQLPERGIALAPLSAVVGTNNE